jgi:hypothetical protein
MGVAQRPGRLTCNPQGVADRELPLPPDPVAQALALDVGHGEPEVAGRLAGIEDREDMRVLQPGGELDLALEPIGAEGDGHRRQEDLEGDGSLVLEVPGEIDRGHPAPAELALDEVAIGQGLAQAR